MRLYMEDLLPVKGEKENFLYMVLPVRLRAGE